MLVRLLLLAIAGAGGTMARYGIQHHAAARSWSPVAGTLLVNLVGCLAFGLIWGALHERDLLHGDLRVVLLTGFLGAFTTFSAFIADSAGLARSGDPTWAALNIVGQVMLGGLLLGIGVFASRSLMA
jgi:CrcB protein